MLFTINNPRISYIGPHSENSFSEYIITDTFRHVSEYTKMLDIIYESIVLNTGIDIKITCINLCAFSYGDDFFNEPIDSVSIKHGTRIISERIIDIIKKTNSRILLYVPSTYFLGSHDTEQKEYAIRLISRFSEILDLIGVDYPSICIRIGSAYGNRKSTMANFVNTVNSLDRGIADKLCIMNDDKPSLFSVTDLLVGVYYKVNIPICFRLLPHQFNDGNLSIRQALFLSCSTWKPEHKPIFIHAESEHVDENGISMSAKPIDYLRHTIPTFGIDIDVIIDSIAKEDSCLKYRMEYKKLKPIIITKKINRKNKNNV